MIHVLLVDDQTIVREGIKRLLSGLPDLKIIDSVSNGESAIRVAREKKPHVILMDLDMPGIGGFEATRKIILRDPKIKVIVLTMYTADPFPAKLLQSGAVGYLSKSADPAELITAIKTVIAGKRYINPEIAERVVLKTVSDQVKNPLAVLSEREFQIMMHIANGIKVKTIAKLLNLSDKTINTCRYRMFAKLGISNNVALTRLAAQHGLLSPKLIH